MKTEFRHLARVLQGHRIEFATAMLGSFSGWDKFPEASSPDPTVRAEFVQRELLAFIDYLALYFEKSDESYLDLYVGEKLKQCHDPRDSSSQALERRRQIVSADRKSLLEHLQPLLDANSLSALMLTLGQIANAVSGEAANSVRVLFVGDCIHIDVVSFLARPLLTEGLRLEPRFATSKNPVELHRSLRDLKDEHFDLIFFSPFSYAFHLEYSQLLYLRTAFLPAARIRALMEPAQRDTEATLQLLMALFDAPIFVHNSTGVRRHDGSLAERAKNLLTQRVRSYARRQVNAWLPALLQMQHPSQLFLLDEAALLQQHSEDELGREFYHAGLQHPAELGRWVAGLYLDAILAQAVLCRKKLIVCDLDNTLWIGAIGEGAVEHILERQQILKDLRNRGMLLAINSKNDPKNVTWDGAVLTAEDFVSTQINWSPKSQNMRLIAEELNLKTKDFLFLDDRTDERAMMAESMPEVMTLDPESPTLWRRLKLAAKLLPQTEEIDRTQAYHQRAKRNELLQSPAQSAADQAAVFRKLEFRIRTRAAAKKDVARVADLINRTNQFNLCGTRTTVAEVTRWLHSPAHRILVLDAQDKFGSMGTVSIAVLEKAGDGIHILAFVLSCRVFGYGVETALLNTIKRIAGHSSNAHSQSSLPLRGRYIETTANGPCRHVYRDHAFTLQGDVWTYAGGGLIEDPDWLTIVVEPIGPLQ